MLISLIAAVADNNVIGTKGKLPWHLPADLAHFKKVTTGHTILMGQTTYESIGKPLPGRTNIVLSNDPKFKADGCIVVHSIEEGLKVAEKYEKEELFVIGGASVYKQLMEMADKIYLTKIHHNFAGDVYFPEIDVNKWKIISKEVHKSDAQNPHRLEFLTLKRQ